MIPETLFMHFYELRMHEGWQRFRHNPALIDTPNLTKLEDMLTGPLGFQYNLLSPELRR